MVKVDFFDIPVDDIDRVLMCTDGLTNMVSDEEISRVLSKDISPKQQAQTLLTKALDAGGKDNVTIIVIDPKKDEENDAE